MELPEYKEHILNQIDLVAVRQLESLKTQLDKLLEEYNDKSNVKNLKEITEAKEYIVKMQLNIKTQQDSIDAAKQQINSIY